MKRKLDQFVPDELFDAEWNKLYDDIFKAKKRLIISTPRRYGKNDVLDSLIYTSGGLYPSESNETKVPDQLPKGYNHESHYENVIKSSKLYTPPPKEYDEPIEDLYDWDTGKIRD